MHAEATDACFILQSVPFLGNIVELAIFVLQLYLQLLILGRFVLQSYYQSVHLSHSQLFPLHGHFLIDHLLGHARDLFITLLQILLHSQSIFK